MKFYIRRKICKKNAYKKKSWCMELCFMGISVQRTQGNAKPANNSSETSSIEGYSSCTVSTFFFSFYTYFVIHLIYFFLHFLKGVHL